MPKPADWCSSQKHTSVLHVAVVVHSSLGASHGRLGPRCGDARGHREHQQRYGQRDPYAVAPQRLQSQRRARVAALAGQQACCGGGGRAA